MQYEAIANRYVTAFKKEFSDEEFVNLLSVFEGLSQAFTFEKFSSVMLNPKVGKNDKLTILKDAVKTADSKELENVLALIVEKGRIEVIPDIASVMKKSIDQSTGNFQGKVLSNFDLDDSLVSGIESSLSKKLDATISLTFVPSKFDGIKVEVEGLGVELDFSKERLNSQLIEHILRAI